MKNITALILTIIFSLVTSIVFAQTIPLAKTGQTIAHTTSDDGDYENWGPLCLVEEEDGSISKFGKTKELVTLPAEEKE